MDEGGVVFGEIQFGLAKVNNTVKFIFECDFSILSSPCPVPGEAPRQHAARVPWRAPVLGGHRAGESPGSEETSAAHERLTR